MARKRARRNYGRGQINEYQTQHGPRFQARCPGGTPTKGGFLTREDAQAWIDAQSTAPVSAAGTLGEWLTEWLKQQRANTAANTWRRDEEVVAAHVRPQLGPVRVRDLTAGRVNAWLTELAEAGATPDQRHRAWVTLRKCLRAHDGFPRSNLEHVRTPKVRRKKPKFLTHEQYAHLVATAASWADTHPYLAALVRVGVECCARPGELFGLRWENYDGRAVTIEEAISYRTGERGEPKTEASVRTIPLSGETRAALDAWRAAAAPRPADPVFPTPGQGKRWGSSHWKYHNFRQQVWNPLAAAAGLAGHTMYALRHAGASLLAADGGSPVAIAQRMGHTTPTMVTRTYFHAMPNDAERLTAIFSRIRTPGQA